MDRTVHVDGSDRPDGLPRRSSISVVIPAFNEAATIGACLASLRAQDWDGDVEILVVDNGSTDATAGIALAAGATVLFEPRRGVCHARQRGTAASAGDIVVSTDADTTFPTTWLSQIHGSLADRTDFVATCGPCHFVDGPWWSGPYTRALFGVTDWLYRRTSRVIYATATNIAFRRSAWTNYDTRLTQGGDELGLLRSLRREGRIGFDPRRMTFTSSRRLRHGLVYNIFVTCLFFYLTAYHVNRLAGRTILGNAPVIRQSAVRTSDRRRQRVAAVAAGLVALCLVHWLTPIDVV